MDCYRVLFHFISYFSDNNNKTTGTEAFSNIETHICHCVLLLQQPPRNLKFILQFYILIRPGSVFRTLNQITNNNPSSLETCINQSHNGTYLSNTASGYFPHYDTSLIVDFQYIFRECKNT